MQPTPERRSRPAHPRVCNVARTLELVGERWTLLVVRELMLQNHRFDQIAARTGVARNILTARLTALVDAGLVTRRRYSERPPRDEYLLTEAGEALMPVVQTLMAWGDEHLPDGQPAPTVFRHDCGERFVPQLVCRCCSRPADIGALTPIRLGGRDL